MPFVIKIMVTASTTPCYVLLLLEKMPVRWVLLLQCPIPYSIYMTNLGLWIFVSIGFSCNFIVQNKCLKWFSELMNLLSIPWYVQRDPLIQKFSEIAIFPWMTTKFEKLHGREISFRWFAKTNSYEKQFLNSLGNFFAHHNFLPYFTSDFCLRESNFVKINSRKVS